MQETFNFLPAPLRGSLFRLRGDAILNADANQKIQIDRLAENGDEREGDKNAVHGSGDEHGADGDGAHQDVDCEDFK